VPIIKPNEIGNNILSAYSVVSMFNKY